MNHPLSSIFTVSVPSVGSIIRKTFMLPHVPHRDCRFSTLSRVDNQENLQWVEFFGDA